MSAKPTQFSFPLYCSCPAVSSKSYMATNNALNIWFVPFCQPEIVFHKLKWSYRNYLLLRLCSTSIFVLWLQSCKSGISVHIPQPRNIANAHYHSFLGSDTGFLVSIPSQMGYKFQILWWRWNAWFILTSPTLGFSPLLEGNQGDKRGRGTLGQVWDTIPGRQKGVNCIWKLLLHKTIFDTKTILPALVTSCFEMDEGGVWM